MYQRKKLRGETDTFHLATHGYYFETLFLNLFYSQGYFLMLIVPVCKDFAGRKLSVLHAFHDYII